MTAERTEPYGGKGVNFPPPSGQVDYAAIVASWVFNSNGMGLS